jgi:hypothetical protein
LKPVEQVLKDANVKKEGIDEVSLQMQPFPNAYIQIVQIVLVGGSTRIPKVQQLLKDYFDNLLGKFELTGIPPAPVNLYVLGDHTHWFASVYCSQ